MARSSCERRLSCSQSWLRGAGGTARMKGRVLLKQLQEEAKKTSRQTWDAQGACGNP